MTQEPPANPASILTVQDSKSESRELSAILRQAGYTVRASVDCEDALRAAEEAPPDLVLLDVDLPAVQPSSWRALEELSRSIPVIVIAPTTDPHEPPRRPQANAVDYLTRPFRADEVLSRVGVHLELQRVRGELSESRRLLTAAIAGRRQAEDAQRESERFLGAIAGHIPAHLAYLDQNRRFLFLNQRFADAFGRPGATLTGGLYREVVNDTFYRISRDNVEVAFSGETATTETELDHPGLGQRCVLMSCLPDIDPCGATTGVFMFGVDLTERKRLENELRRSTLELTQVEHRERRRLARVLHDQMQQVLAAARLEVVRVSRLLPGNDAVAHIDSLLQDCLAETRTLTVQLCPPVLDEDGLVAGLRWLARWMKQTHHLSVDLRADEGVRPRDPGLRAVLFSVVRELLFNVVKHSGVAHAELVVEHGPGATIRISVHDAGVGFEVSGVGASASAVSGFGLFASRERLSLFGGRLEVDSRPGRGTRVVTTVPSADSSVSREPDVETRVAQPETQVDNVQAAAVVAPRVPVERRVRVLVADDHPVVRGSLVRVLREMPGIEVIGEANDGEEAVALALRLRPDVVLMDIAMPRIGGIEATRRIKAREPGIRVIGLSMQDTDEVERAMRAAGAEAHLDKGRDCEALIATILTSAPAPSRGDIPQSPTSKSPANSR